MPAGSMVIAILLHVPYVRRAGVWPQGESQLFGAIADSFLPVLDGLARLRDEGLSPRVTLALSPLLAEQLADPLLRSGFEQYMLRRIAGHERAAAGLGAPQAAVARWHIDRDNRLLESWSVRHRRDIVRTVRELALDGAVEIAGVPASAAVLPLLPSARAVALQVHMGLVAAERHVEHRPIGMWLPGGAIAPRGALEPLVLPDLWNRAMYSFDDSDLPGTDDVLRDHGVTYAFSGEQALLGGRPDPDGASPLDLHVTERNLVLLTRHDRVFSAWFDPDRGLRGDPSYLGSPDAAGDRYWRRSIRPGETPLTSRRAADIEMTVAASPPESAYEPDLALATARSQALQAAATAKGILDEHRERTGRPGVIVLPVDALCFEDWIEGPDWLTEFIRATSEAKIASISGAEAVHHYTPLPLEAVHPSSWEAGGDFRLWRAPNTTWYWDVVASVFDTTESLVDRFGSATQPLLLRGLAQVVREALLLVEGEWPAMLGAGGESRDYAAHRVRQHHDRFRHLAEMVGAGDFGENFDTALLERFEEQDNPFELLDYGIGRTIGRGRDEDEAEPEPWIGMGPGGLL